MKFTFADKEADPYTPFGACYSSLLVDTCFQEHFPLVLTGRGPTSYGLHGFEKLVLTTDEMWPLTGCKGLDIKRKKHGKQ